MNPKKIYSIFLIQNGYLLSHLWLLHEFSVKISLRISYKNVLFFIRFYPSPIISFFSNKASVMWQKILGPNPIRVVIYRRALSYNSCPSFFSFNGLFAPYWRSDARGMMIGLTQFTTKDHICRAALESVAFQVRGPPLMT